MTERFQNQLREMDSKVNELEEVLERLKAAGEANIELETKLVMLRERLDNYKRAFEV